MQKNIWFNKITVNYSNTENYSKKHQAQKYEEKIFDSISNSKGSSLSYTTNRLVSALQRSLKWCLTSPYSCWCNSRQCLRARIRSRVTPLFLLSTWGFLCQPAIIPQIILHPGDPISAYHPNQKRPIQPPR